MISLFLININTYIAILLKILLLLLFPLILYFLNFFEQVELDRVNGFLKKWKNPKQWRKNIKEIRLK